ncbi:tigger transposable element-derived protein 6-like [Anastrepha obliqua]|uniref:tigger transposable element-derived protein 6-like n=1 Tax=Anastrepha obliqua TaxID=95512 RepID=UPI00240A6A67|nr:tigger transposable element-derived protein 6-like [Anastrepha obliqua]
MTSTLWSEIIQELDNDMVAKDKNILLFVDNASCHKINFKPRNIEIEFLPPNTTALIQPLDQGIIHAFKAEYRKILVRKQISAIERGVPLQTYIKSISILDVLHYIKRAWWLVKPETICNCFKKAGICNTNADVVSCEVELGILEEIPNTEEYIHCDDELQCRGLLTDEQIVANLCDVPSSDISSGDENSEENHDVSKATSVKEYTLSKMRPKGLTQAEIERFANFDWDDSADNEIEEKEDQNMEEIIEETLKNLDNRAKNVEVGLIDQIIGSKDDEDLNENEIVAQEVMEKINFNSLKWSSAEFMKCETTWKNKLCSNAVKKPIEYFSTFFTDELWLKICEETNLYAMQTKGIQL